MQHHTVQQLDRGPRVGQWVYTGGNDRMGRYVECCAEAYLTVLQSPAGERDASPAWAEIGHDTAAQAYAHMRQVLLGRLRLDVTYSNWSGCRAPASGGGVCAQPVKQGADIGPCHFSAPLCDEHRNQATVEAMWPGPGDWSGSW